ncbi:MAG: glycosyltransferase [Patescibacteria group bacterium]|nr:glycosyltransferase [Patescibacteria group bacterium]
MISFVIPTLNEEKVLAKLLQNLREIKTIQYEIIVSDGNSMDKTLEIAWSLADKVVVYREARRQTIGQARNLGAAQAQGDFLVFLDADVHIANPDDFFSRALNHFAQDPQLAGLGGWLKVFPEMETLGDRIGYGIFSNWSFYLHNNVFKVGGNCGEFGMIKSEIFHKLNGYNETLAADEDFELFRRLAKIGRVKTDPRLLVFHTGRRPHQIGWAKLLWTWTLDYLYAVFLHRSASKEWTVIR